MPIPQLFLANAILGLGCAWVARSEIRLASRSSVASAAFGALLLGQVLLMIPLGLYLYLFYPDWSLLYVVPASAVPSAVVVFVIGGYPLVAVGSYFGAVSLCRASRENLVVGLMGGLGLVILVALGLGWRRFGHVGTFDQYHRLFGLSPLHGSGLGAFLLLALPALGGAWGWGLHRLRRALAQK